MFVIKYMLFTLIFLFFCDLFFCKKLFKLKIKRDAAPTYDKSLYTFNGFEKVASVPVLFPLDICLLNVKGVQYAASLHINRNGEQQLSVFIFKNSQYKLFAQSTALFAVDMDCLSYGGMGYIAIALNLVTEPKNALEGSPIFQINDKGLSAVQFFGNKNLNSVYLTATNDDLLMMQSFRHQNGTKPNCPYYRWAGSSFRQLGNIPCTNAQNMDPFAMNHEHYVAVANYADYNGRTSTNSEVYKYDSMKKKFVIFQKIITHGSTDVRYFDVHQENELQHFLLFGNTLRANDRYTSASADSIFFIFDQNQFVPYQSLTSYNIKQFLPVKNTNMEKFLLLVNGDNQDIKIFDLNNWKFEESKIQFTEGAFSKGISSMRCYQEKNETFLVIANKFMMENETNIYRPIFRQDEHSNILRHKIINWAYTQKLRLGIPNDTQIMKEAELKLENFQHTKTKKDPKIPNLIKANKILKAITKSFSYPPYKLNKNYWTALSYANQGLEVLETQLFYIKPRFRREKDELEKTEYIKNIEISTAVVRNKLIFNKMNRIDLKFLLFENIKTRKLIINKHIITRRNEGLMDHTDIMQKNTTVMQKLFIEDLELNGNFNGLIWIEELLNKTLKQNAPYQFVKSKAFVGKLNTQTLFVENDALNNKNINHLISIENGDYVIEQNIQFASPLVAHKLTINERIDNINVINGKLNVLLKDVNFTQIMEGFKHMSNINILEPIMLSGRLNGEELESLSPVKVISENLILMGNYSIMGDINVENVLKSYDLNIRINSQRNLNAKQYLQRAINLIYDKIKNLVMHFKFPIIATNSIAHFINTKDIQHLLKYNSSEIQIIYGEKNIPYNLQIYGKQNNVKILNSIEMDNLSVNLLLKQTNQTICVPMNVGSIITKSINSKDISLNKSVISIFLTKDTLQHIKGSLKVGVLHVQFFNTTYLHTKGKMFHIKLENIYQQKAKMAPNKKQINIMHDFYCNIYAENLKMPPNSMLNGRKIEIIERQLTQLTGNMKYVGNFSFNYPLNITQLNFDGELNNIDFNEFGNCWLQHNGRQLFIGGQTLSFVETTAILLNGVLNMHTIVDYVRCAYWINRDEILPRTLFKKTTFIKGDFYATLVNGLQIPLEVLLKTTFIPQILEENIKLHGFLKVYEHLQNVIQFNDFPMLMVKKLLNHRTTNQSLHVKNAFFQRPPLYESLNKRKINNLLNKVWFLNEDKQLSNMKLEEIHFAGLLDFDESLNGIHIQQLKNKYFSLSQHQEIISHCTFNGQINFADQINTRNIQIIENSTLIDLESEIAFNFSNFVCYTLKQEKLEFISGNWQLKTSTICGNLYNGFLNGLDLGIDIVRFDQPLPCITKFKSMIDGKIKQLYAISLSLVNQINVADWIKSTIYEHANQTIKGWTTIEEVNVKNYLRVRGNLNGIIFKSDYIVLCDRKQTVYGDLILNNLLRDDSKGVKSSILSINFSSLFVQNINSIDIQNFLLNQAHLNSNVDITARVCFMQPVHAEVSHISYY